MRRPGNFGPGSNVFHGLDELFASAVLHLPTTQPAVLTAMCQASAGCWGPEMIQYRSCPEQFSSSAGWTYKLMRTARHNKCASCDQTRVVWQLEGQRHSVGGRHVFTEEVTSYLNLRRELGQGLRR